MSYILDALKKLERERKRGNVPGILTAEELKIKEKKEKKRFMIWPYLLTFALLLNAGLFIWWMQWEKEKTKVIHGGNIDKSSAFNKAVNSSEKPDIESVTAVKKDEKNEALTGKKREKPDDSSTESAFYKNNLDEGTLSGKAKSKEIIAKISNNDAKESKNPLYYSAHSSVSPPIKNKIYNIDELPSQIKQELPNLKITISLYSDDPTTRMAQINNIMLREGQYLVEGLKLEKINPRDLIFNYKDYRFRIGLH